MGSPFFRNAQPWMVALVVTLPALLGLLAGTWYVLRKEIQALYQEKERERAEKEAAQAEKQRERSAKERLQDELRWTKTWYRPRAERSQVYAADVFLDPNTAHPTLRVSEDKRSLQRKDTRWNLPDNPERFSWYYCVLGSESFTSGRHFWEVDVGDRREWLVGVCREDVERKCWVKMTPKEGFWVMRLSHENDYWAHTDPQTKLTVVSPPEMVGVFLDYGIGEVSFYNAIDGSHIFTFPHTCFSGPLRPVFKILDVKCTPLTICPAQKAVRRSLGPAPGPAPSLETPVAPGSADENGDPQAEETSLLPAQPGAEGLLNSETSQQENTY